MKDTKSEILLGALKKAIENDHSDLASSLLHIKGYDTDPRSDAEHICRAIYNRADDTIQLLLDENFACNSSDAVSRLFHSLSYCSSDLSAYVRVLDALGKEAITKYVNELTHAALAKKTSYISHPLALFSATYLDSDEALRRYQTLLSYIDFDEISEDDFVSAFYFENLKEGSHSVLALEKAKEAGLFDSMREENRVKLFKYLSSSHSTDAINHCFVNGIFNINDLDEVDDSEISFFLISELHYAGINIKPLLIKAFGNGKGDKIKSFITNITNDISQGSAHFSHPALTFYCDIVSGNFTIEYDSLKDVFFKAAISTDNIQVLTYMLDKILTDGKSAGEFLLDEDRLSMLSRPFSRFSSRVSHELLSMISKHPAYIEFVSKSNQEAEIKSDQESISKNYYKQFDTMYLFLSSQDDDLPYTSQLMKSARPNRDVIYALIRRTMEQRPQETDYAKARQLLCILSDYIDEDMRDYFIQRKYWYEPSGFSFAKEFSALEKTSKEASSNAKRFEKLINIALSPEKHFYEYLSRISGLKNPHERLQECMKLRGVDPSSLLFDENVNDPAKALIAEILS